MSRGNRDDHDQDEERPRWRDAEEDGDEPRDWEIEPEEEREDRHSVLGGTAPVARVVFFALLLLIVIGGGVLAVAVLREHFNR